MSEIKRGVVMLIQAGDPEISGALASGALAGRRKGRRDLSCRGCAAPPTPEGEGLTEDQRRVVSAEMDRQAILEDMREAIGNTKTADDYANMRFQAEVDYGESVYYPTRFETLLDKALGIYGLIVYGMATAFHAQDRVLRG